MAVEILAAPKEVADYHALRWWNDFYEAELAPFEWYHPYPMIRGIIRRYVSETELVLHIGCGNSRMTEDLVEDGYESITSIDFSRVVVEQMVAKYAGVLPEACEFIQLDVCDLKPDPVANDIKRGIADEAFNVVLDKGTFDSILCSNDGEKNIRKALHEIDRVLAADGIFIFMSHNDPGVVIKYIDATDDEKDESLDFYSWNTEAHQIAKPTIDRNKLPDLFQSQNTYFIYVCIKDEERHVRKLAEFTRRKKTKERAEKNSNKEKMKQKGR